MINVIAALIFKDNKVLIAKRSTGDVNNLGKWEFPGGKAKSDESDEEAIEREIKEEFELNIKAKKYITNNIYKYPNKVINLKLYECEYISGSFNLHDHSEYKYVNINELLDYDLSRADINLAKYVEGEYNEKNII